MSVMAFQITSLTIVCATVYSGVDQRKHQSSASLAFVRGIHRWPVNSPHKVRKMFPFDDVIMAACIRKIFEHDHMFYMLMAWALHAEEFRIIYLNCSFQNWTSHIGHLWSTISPKTFHQKSQSTGLLEGCSYDTWYHMLDKFPAILPPLCGNSCWSGTPWMAGHWAGKPLKYMFWCSGIP